MNPYKFLKISLLLTQAQMKSRYRKTVAGFLWVVLNPILLFGVHALIFKAILKVNIPDYFMFLLGGLLPWIFITNNFMMATNSFITQRDVIKSFSISPLSLIFAHTMDNFINFIAAFLLIFGLLIFRAETDLLILLTLPLSVLIILIFTFSVTSILATLQVFFRDIQFITQFFNNIMYLLTPIFYPPEYIPEDYRWLVQFNPYYIIIRPCQLALNNYAGEDFIVSILKALGLTIAAILMSRFVWNRSKSKIYHYI